nr:hypothetical protein [Nanoarchaeum sp.]
MPIRYLSYGEEDTLKAKLYKEFFTNYQHPYNEDPVEINRLAFEYVRKETQRRVYDLKPLPKEETRKTLVERIRHMKK